jgi:hypothetical protein
MHSWKVPPWVRLTHPSSPACTALVGALFTVLATGVGSPALGSTLRPQGSSAEAPDEIEAMLKASRLEQKHLLAKSGGTDLALGGTREVTIAIDPNNPLRMAYADLGQMRVSTDGGVTFQTAVGAQVPAGFGGCGDPSVAYDSQGRLFWTYLGCGAGSSIDVFMVQCSPTTGAILAGYPVNMTASAGVNLPASAGNAHDKEWIAIDDTPGSPFQDNIYIVWVDLTGASTIRVATSTDQGATWSLAAALSGAGEGFVWPPHITTATNGDVYVAYHSMTSNGTVGQVFVCRSTDGGATFPQKNNAYDPGEADATFNRQSQPGAIPGTQFWLQGNAQPWILTDPDTPARVYVVASDDPNNDHTTGDAADVFIVRSTNSGGVWTNPQRIDSGPGTTFQVMPTAAIDRHDGCIAVQYYDNRANATNAAGRFLMDVFLTGSVDGGVTWSPDVQINDSPFDPDPGAGCRYGPAPGCVTNEAVTTTRIGEYNGVATANGVAYAVWCGNRRDGAGNATGQQGFFEIAPIDLVAPTINCPASINVECTQHTGTPASDPTIAAFLAGATASDNCDAGPVITTDALAVFPHGLTSVTFTATDAAGNTASCTRSVTVVDTTPPVIACPADITVECSTTNGTPKDDPQLVPFFAGVSATDLCDAAPVITDTAPALFPEGVTPVTFTAKDADGNSSSCIANVEVVDTTPPVITVALNREFLWPPNHKLADIGATVGVTDICDPNPTFVLTSITSNEPENGLGDGDTAPDIVDATFGTPDIAFKLRSERSGKGTGRRYTITYTAMDNAGNTADATVYVRVAHDQSGNAVASVGMAPDGTGFVPDATWFALIVRGLTVEERGAIGEGVVGVVHSANDPEPASGEIVAGFDAGLVFARFAQIGNIRGAVAPLGFDCVDVDRDGLVDLVLYYPVRAALTLREKTVEDGPVGIHFTNRLGESFLVPDIFALGAPQDAARVSTLPGATMAFQWLEALERTGSAAATATVEPAVESESGMGTPGAVQGAVASITPQVTRLSYAHPNPFTGRTSFTFQLAHASGARLEVFSASGARVRTIDAGELPAGLHVVPWDGRHESGFQLPPGVYMVQLTADGVTSRIKAVLLR